MAPKKKRKRGGDDTRVAEAMIGVSPEEEDARVLAESLPEYIAAPLMRATTPLKRLDGTSEAQLPDLLNMYARHQLILRLRAQGMQPDRIARSVGVSKTVVDLVVRNWYQTRAGQLRSESLDQFALLMAEGYLEDIDKLTEVIISTRHPTALIGAIKARQEARQKYIDLLIDVGYLQRTPQQVNVHHDGIPENGDTNVMVVLSTEDLKSASLAFLRQKREARGEQPDDEADQRLANLIVSADDPSIPSPE